MAAPKNGGKPLPPMKRGREVAKKTKETSTQIRTCGNCKGSRCKECKFRGVVDIRMI